MLLGKAALLVAIILQIVIRYPYRNSGKPNASDRQEQFALALLTIGGLILPLIYVFTGWLAFADYPPSAWIVGLGVVMMAAGLWLFWRAHTDLGRNWSGTLEIHDEHRLITEGVYRLVRHPMYSASWLMYAAQAPLLSNWIAGFGGIVGFAALYFLRVPKEEQMMLEQFGEQYRQYMAHTGRVIPKRGSSS